ncbi:family 78 glycoside hydrolase catalytic domain [uncultured Draconibacterium sp.]|uniref:family 78 glycoside hydrolase catalytic domain n=1 Tax=uncultured Draconibacterium sp. TaxID=1573823 RepID=UPI0029C94DC8|nr:family 78 glycoside hydrolase catalytic domain [uncultured Draconibacterium sp.]
MRISILIILCISVFVACNPARNFKVRDLQVSLNPFNLTDTEVVFSWKTRSEIDSFVQSAFEIEMVEAEEESGFNWHLKSENSDKQFGIKYSGEELTPGKQYKWRVRVNGNKGQTSEWSEYEHFWFLDELSKHTNAKWITYQADIANAQPVFGKTFKIANSEKIKNAQLLVAGLGYYEVCINGEKIGDHVLDPAQTNYNEYAFYVHYPVPAESFNEDNEIKILLGDGFYNQNLVWAPAMSYGKPKVVASLQITFNDGTSKIIDTGENWMWTNGPIERSNIYAGEHYNATKESVLKNSIDGNWLPVSLAKSFPPKVIPQTIKPIRVTETIQAQKIIRNGDKTIFDFGQNFAGVVELNVSALAETKITLRYAEKLYPDSTLDMRSTGVFATNQEQCDSYICSGNSTEKWMPRFTYHGFRYVELEGIENPSKGVLTGKVLHTDLEQSGSFSCSSETINRLHKMSLWSLRSNLHGIPTDCPHREKCGWLGDAHVVAPTLIQNFNSHAFLKKYLYDIRSSANINKSTIAFKTNFHDRVVEEKPAGIPFMIAPGKRNSGMASADWGTAVVQLPWLLYVYYADTRVLNDFYPLMKQWVDYIHEQGEEGIIKYGLGDWCPPGAHKAVDTPIPVTSTAFHYLDIDILSKTAKIVGKQDDAILYRKMKNEVKQSFNQHFFAENSRSYGSQTANALALEFGLVPEGLEKEVSNAIVENINTKYDGFIHTGMFGTRRIFSALCEYGNEEAADFIFSKSGYNSFPYMWEHYDATTMWEVLPVDDYYDNPEKNDQRRSFNHSIQFGFDAWFFYGIAGIRPVEEEPGFKRITFKPGMFNFLKNARANYNSPFGVIKSSWENTDQKFRWSISVPPNSVADFYIPVNASAGEILVNGSILKFHDVKTSKDGNRYFVLQNQLSGVYTIEVASANLVQKNKNAYNQAK